MLKNVFLLFCACLLPLVACSGAEQQAELPTRAQLPTTVPTDTPTATPTSSPTPTPTVTPVPPNVIPGGNGVSLEIERFEVRVEAGSYTPENDAYLVLFGVFHNQSASAQRIYARDVRLILDGIEYAPQNGPMGAIQDALDTARPYVGAYRGQEVAANASASTFAVFDISFDVGAAELALHGQSKEIAVSWQAAAVALAATEPTVSMTATVAPTDTITPTPTSIATMTPSAATQSQTSERNLARELEDVFSVVDGVTSVEPVSVQSGNDGFVVDVVARVEPGYVTTNVANLLRLTTYDTLGTDDVWFYVILDDGARRVDHSWNKLRGEWLITELSTPVSTSSPAQPQQEWICTDDRYNCSDFSTCSEVMNYFNVCPGDPSGLDRDNDRQPCESLCGG